MTPDTTPVPMPPVVSRDSSSTGSRVGFLKRQMRKLSWGSSRDEEKGVEVSEVTRLDKTTSKSKKVGWKKLTVLLIVEAIALGTLGMPSAFAALGMVAGVILTIVFGIVAIFAGILVGKVKVKHPDVKNYADAVRLFFGSIGYWITAAMFVLFLVLLVGSHVLTGTMAFVRLVNQPLYCALIWGGISAVILFLLALPPSFKDFTPFGYIDCASILIAIFIIIIATGINAHNAPGGLSAVAWSVWLPSDMSFYKVFLAVSKIIFAYSFTVCQLSLMADMHTPTDFKKTVYSIGLIEIVLYTTTGALIYAFVGEKVQSPALLSASPLISKIAFGMALPVIFISGSINSIVVGRYVMNNVFPNSLIKMVNTTRGWLIWISLIAAITGFAFLIAESIPFFDALLGLISSVFISGFSFYFPALFWFCLLKEGKWHQGWRNRLLSIVNILMIIIGLVLFGAGTYSSTKEIKARYHAGNVRTTFSCDSKSYI